MTIKIYGLIILTALFFGLGCNVSSFMKTAESKENNVKPTNTGEVKSTPKAEETTANTEPNEFGTAIEKDYLAFANGTIIVQEPKDSDDAQLAWSPYNLIDESAEVSWESYTGNNKDQVFVFEMAEKTLLKKFSFDTRLQSFDENAAKDIKVEISDTSKSDGFQEVLSATLAHLKDNQKFDVAKPIAGRFVRLTVKNNYGGENKVSLNEIRGFGEQITNTAKLENLSGTYEMGSGIGDLHIKQEGTSVVGCYDYRNGVFSGGTEGRLLKVNLTEEDSDGKPAKAVGIYSFSADGKAILGFSKGVDSSGPGFDSFWSGTKINNDIGECKQFKDIKNANSGQTQLEKDLSDDGRAVIYGINFDFNSDVIREESKAVLNTVLGVLKAKADWKMTIEGHTDNIGGEAFNKTLSDKRANAVKNYLVKNGIEATRLTASGIGLSKPIATNDTEAGRSQNRRVELLKN
jgi:OmpA-OmpF porin, OOP family